MSITFTTHFVALLSMLSHPENYLENRIYKVLRSEEELISKLNFPEITMKR